MESELSVEISKQGKFFGRERKGFVHFVLLIILKQAFVKMTVPFKKH